MSSRTVKKPSDVIKAKQDYLSAKKEEISQLLVDYDYKNNDWASWRNQTFA